MKEDLLLTGGVKLKIKAMPFIRFSCVAAYFKQLNFWVLFSELLRLKRERKT
jgi:hypothetical protein